MLLRLLRDRSKRQKNYSETPGCQRGHVADECSRRCEFADDLQHRDSRKLRRRRRHAVPDSVSLNARRSVCKCSTRSSCFLRIFLFVAKAEMTAWIETLL